MGPSREPSPKISKNLIEQFDTKDIEQAWIPAYKQMIIDNYDVFSLNEFDRGHTIYNAYNAELTGIVAALEHFYHYLKGSRTTVITDHLHIVKNGKRDNNTMDALRIEMNKLDMEILHIRGDTMPADSLSRQAKKEAARQAKQETKLAGVASALDAETTPTMSEQQWKWEQKRDTTCREIRAFIEDKRLSLTPEVQNIIDLL